MSQGRHRQPKHRRIAGTRGRPGFASLSLLVAAGVISVVVPPSAFGAAGSAISGVVWADTNRDQTHQVAEGPKAGVTVQVVRSPSGAVVATTTTNATGKYGFADVADGTYQMVVTAPGAFALPAAATGPDNKFSRQGVPAAGQPERGVSTPLTINGATAVANLSAGLQPVANLTVAQLAAGTPPASCQGQAEVGTAPFDATNGAGKSTGTGAGACLLRTSDTASQNYAISMTGLPKGTSVDNVVVDFTISSADGATYRFAGPNGGLPTGCLATGVTPASSIDVNADGSVTLHCNMGTFSSAVKPISVPILALNSSLDGSHVHLSAQAHAAAGDAGLSNQVTGPDIQVTGAPSWNIRKTNYHSATTESLQTINGVRQRGYVLQYEITLNPLASRGETDLKGPLHFVDKLNAYPNASILGCRMANGSTDGLANQVGSLTCPMGQAQGSAGFALQLSGIDGLATSTTGVIDIFVPEQDAYRAIDPAWQPGDPVPSGTAPVTNSLISTEGWKDAQGHPNNVTGFEAGWDGTTATGDNVVNNTPLVVAPPPQPGPPSGGKSYFSPKGGCCTPIAAAGNQVGSKVVMTTDINTTIPDPHLCDVWDVSIWKLDDAHSPVPPAGYVMEFAQGPNGDDLQSGPQNKNGTWPFNSTPLKKAAAGCNTAGGPWVPYGTSQAATSAALVKAFGTNWQDTVNMARLRPVDPATSLLPGSTLLFNLFMHARSTYNGGPHAGQQIPFGVQAPNEGGITDPSVPSHWRTNEAVLSFTPFGLGISKSVPQSQYEPGSAVPWTLQPAVTIGAAGETIHHITLTDTLPSSLEYDSGCTTAHLPHGVTASFNPTTNAVTINVGDYTVKGVLPELLFQAGLIVCTTVSPLTPPGTSVLNRVALTTADASNTATATRGILINGTGQLAIQKTVDHALVKPGQTYTWGLDWSNTSANLEFQPTDVIDVLPWQGDGATGSLSMRDQYDSNFTGTHVLTEPLAQPVYEKGSPHSGAVPGTWYYSTAAPRTISDDPRAVSNANPGSGTVWQTLAQVQAGAGIGAVTAVRFVATNPLAHGDHVHASLSESSNPKIVSGRSVLNGVYDNRAQIYSPTFPDQPLKSNENYVLMPGFSIGDLVWADNNHTGIFATSPAPAADGLPGVPIEVLDASGTPVATTTTNAEGRWVVQGLREGTYRVRIPASAFKPGGVLEHYRAATHGSNADTATPESKGNKNTAAPEPATSGLTSAPVTFAYTLDSDGYITGGNQPASGDDDPSGLSDPMLPTGFENLNMDLAVEPTPSIALVKSVVSPANGGAATKVGDVITYNFHVTNTGGLPLTKVTVTDTQAAPAGALTSGPTCPKPTLLPGASEDCTATYTVTQADIEHGRVDDTAVAHGTLPDSTTPVESNSSTVTVATVLPTEPPAADPPVQGIDTGLGSNLVERANGWTTPVGIVALLVALVGLVLIARRLRRN